MKINNIIGSATLAEEPYIRQEYLTLNLKFFHITAEELNWLWRFIKKEFYLDMREQFFLRFGSEEKNVRERYLEQFLLSKQDVNDIWVNGIYKDSRFGKIRSVSGAERFFDERFDRYEEHEISESMQDEWKSRADFTDDNDFLRYVRRVLTKENKPVMTNGVWPDISWEFYAEHHEETDEFYGMVEWSMAGELTKYSYDNTAQELWRIFDVISGTIKQVVGNIYLMPFSTSNGSPFCEVFRFGIRDRYGELPEKLFLLGGIEWLNYVPYDLMKDCKPNVEKLNDSHVVIKRCKNGCFFVINKSIAEVTVEDKRHMRRYYLDKFLMKGREVLTDDWGSESGFMIGWKDWPVFEEEIQLYIGTECDGTTVYGVEYVPVDFPFLM